MHTQGLVIFIVVVVVIAVVAGLWLQSKLKEKGEL